MATLSSPSVLLIIVVASLLLSATCGEEPNSAVDLNTYIVHVLRPPAGHNGTHRQWHESFLPHSSRLIYSYDHILSAFAARLTAAELQSIKAMDGVLHAEPEQFLSLQTTYTPSFLGLNPVNGNFWSATGYGRGIIIGVLDTGIAPSHPSFDDEGMSPPPPKWKGTCQLTRPYRCNNKLIGARSFLHSDPSATPLDINGHGTHTAGTAAGTFVRGASLLGNALGTAAGVAPLAHLAAYRVCGSATCSDADVLAGIEQAVKDGVDVLSISLGVLPEIFYTNAIAIATYNAVSKGVFVSAAASNDGSFPSTVRNAAPWILTVGASSVDRKIVAVVKLGNSREFQGESGYQPTNFPSTQLPLVYPSSVPYCNNSAMLRGSNVRGKIVLCQYDTLTANIEKGMLVKEAGGAAMIIMNPYFLGYDTLSEPHMIPASQVSYADGLSIIEYYQSVTIPTATIAFKGTVIGDGNAPAVAAFSSRGPSIISPGILKPDIIGPGLNVLAASPFPVGPFPDEPAFNMMSGTSMACPHLSGVAALLKNMHPDWSPAMIKSAIMTTAYTTKRNGDPITDLADNGPANFYAMGAGHVDPAAASNPGLVYDTLTQEYVAYLCGLGYTEAQVRLITADPKTTCARKISEAELNYPSISVDLNNAVGYSRDVYRTVTNVGAPTTRYVASFVRRSGPSGITLTVEPQRLEFTGVGQRRSFRVRFGIERSAAAGLSGTQLWQGWLTWSSLDGKTRVNSPLSVRVGERLSQSTGMEPYQMLPLALRAQI